MGAGVFVGTGVAVGADVAVGAGVFVGTDVAVGAGVFVGTGVAVGGVSGVLVGASAAVGVDSSVFAGTNVAVGAASGALVGTDVGVGAGVFVRTSVAVGAGALVGTAVGAGALSGVGVDADASAAPAVGEAGASGALSPQACRQMAISAPSNPTRMNPGMNLRGLDDVSPFEFTACSPPTSNSWDMLIYRARGRASHYGASVLTMSRPARQARGREPGVYYIDSGRRGANRAMRQRARTVYNHIQHFEIRSVEYRVSENNQRAADCG